MMHNPAYAQTRAETSDDKADFRQLVQQRKQESILQQPANTNLPVFTNTIIPAFTNTNSSVFTYSNYGVGRDTARSQQSVINTNWTERFPSKNATFIDPEDKHLMTINQFLIMN